MIWADILVEASDNDERRKVVVDAMGDYGNKIAKIVETVSDEDMPFFLAAAHHLLQALRAQHKETAELADVLIKLTGAELYVIDIPGDDSEEDEK